MAKRSFSADWGKERQLFPFFSFSRSRAAPVVDGKAVIFKQVADIILSENKQKPIAE